MGVYIKGMKMPQGESYVTVRIWGDGRVIGVHNDSLVKHAIEIQPHGRLIDADAFVDELGQFCDDNWVYNTLRHAPTIIPAEEGER